MQKYQERDVPSVLMDMQELDSSRLNKMVQVFKNLTRIELDTYDLSMGHVKRIQEMAEAIDPKKEADLFAEWNAQPPVTDYPQFSFEPHHPTDTMEMQTDQHSATFLWNILAHTQKKHATLTTDIENKRKEVAGLRNLQDAYEKNNKHGDPDYVHETLLDTCRLLTLLDTTSSMYQTEMRVIIDAVGDLPTGFVPHEFKAASFTLPTVCDYCSGVIWGLARQGYSCTVCGYNCHTKCELKLPADCTKVAGGAKMNKAKKAPVVEADPPPPPPPPSSPAPQATSRRTRIAGGTTMRPSDPARPTIPAFDQPPPVKPLPSATMKSTNSVLRRTILSRRTAITGDEDDGGYDDSIVMDEPPLLHDELEWQDNWNDRLIVAKASVL
jgi:hypothetical protein